MIDHDSVALHGPTGSSAIRKADIYFAFASGRFSYDCVKCGAVCCRGHGYFSDGPEQELLRSKSAYLPLFVTPPSSSSAAHRVTNCAPGCFFLDDGGRCDIHSQHGSSAKPETCRLFPFNNFRRLGRYLIVAPHDGLCPLALSPDQSFDSASSHDDLVAAMQLRGIARPIRSCRTPYDIGALIGLERAIVSESERHLDEADYIGFVNVQLQIHERMFGGSASDPSTIPAFLENAQDLAGLPGAQLLGTDRELVRTMIAATPAIRARLIFQDVDQGIGDRLPLPLQAVPFAVLATYLLAEAARLAGMRHVTFQTIARLDSEFRPLTLLLAQSHMRLTWRRGAPLNLAGIQHAEVRRAFLRVAKQLVPHTQRASRLTLHQIMKANAPADPWRLVFLKEAGNRISGLTVAVSEGGRPTIRTSLRERIAAEILHFLLAHVPVDMLEEMFR